MESKDLKDAFYRYLRYFLAKDDTSATSYDKYMALAYAVRSELVDSWIKTTNNYREQNVKRVYYLSMEYVFGKNLRHNMVNLGIESPFTTAVRSLGYSIEELYAQEDDFELGYAGKGVWQFVRWNLWLLWDCLPWPMDCAMIMPNFSRTSKMEFRWNVLTIGCIGDIPGNCQT